MPAHTAPAIDAKNPLYCPSVSATTYLSSLRQRVQIYKPSSRRHGDLFISFARILDQSVSGSDFGDEGDAAVDWIVGSYVSHARANNPTVAMKPPSLPPPYSAFVQDVRKNVSNATSRLQESGPGPALHGKMLGLKRRRLSSFSDLQGPPKYSRSVDSMPGSSPDVMTRRKVLTYLVSSSPAPFPNKATSETSKPSTTGADLERLIKDLDAVIPGIRLAERLAKLKNVSHQTITDFLSDHGHLNGRILDILRNTEVEHISLVASLFDENGLNLCGKDLFPAFSKPNSFLSLTELSFSGTSVQDFDLTHIHHLPKLSVLHLNNTGIGNEAVFLLVPLKRTLTQLTLATNPDIDRHAVPAILLLSKLCYLSIADTSIDMTGLRTLSQTVFDEDRVIDIEIPYACEIYIDNIPSSYLINPTSPLITNPDACAQLSCAALKRNLSAHAEKNSSIVTSGTKDEMVERLSGILKTRQMDLLVRHMLGFEDFAATS